MIEHQPMSSQFALGSARTGPRRLTWRWSFGLAAALALHGAAVVWFARHGHAFAPESVKPPLQVALLTPQPIARRMAHATPRRPAGGTRAPESSGPAQVLHALAPSQGTPAPVRASEDDGKATGPSNNTAASASPAAQAGAPTQASAPSVGVRFSVPPSGNLHYNTFYNGVENAPGTIRWSSDGDGYEMIVSVPLPFVGTFSYESHGKIDGFGLAPERYIEKRGHRPQEVTTFDRVDKRIGFTRTTTTLALPDGAQDRFSMVMQLASLVRGDPQAYKSGVTRSFYVADDDSGEPWPIETIGDESIQTAEGFIEARHFMRLPRHEGDKRRIDVWLAPSLGWLPARIVQTEPNGSQIELVWRGPLRPPGAENASQVSGMPDDSSDAQGAAAEGAVPGPAREHP